MPQGPLQRAGEGDQAPGGEDRRPRIAQGEAVAQDGQAPRRAGRGRRRREQGARLVREQRAGHEPGAQVCQAESRAHSGSRETSENRSNVCQFWIKNEIIQIPSILQ